MQILKRRLKKSLSNKILKSQLAPYNIFYIIVDSSSSISNIIKKKKITKLLFEKNFSLLKNSSIIYPLCYISSENLTKLLFLYKTIKQTDDFKKILICNIKVKSFVFKSMNTLEYYNIHDPILVFYKLYLMLNTLLFNFLLVKKSTK